MIKVKDLKPRSGKGKGKGRAGGEYKSEPIVIEDEVELGTATVARETGEFVWFVRGIQRAS